MRHHLSPFRYAFESLLHLVGRGPRRSRLTTARNPESRLRFAQYVSRVQPMPDPTTARRTARWLGHGGAVSRGEVRHAPISDGAAQERRPSLHLLTQPGGVAARRRAQASLNPTSLRSLLHALRVR